MSAYDAIDTSNWAPGTRYFTKITDTDHAGWLYIITLLSFVYALVALAIRFAAKYGMYGHDDWALLGSTGLAIGQYVSVLAALSKGLGKSQTLLGIHRLLELQRYAAAHAYLFVLAHCASKLSTAVLTKRLFDNGSRRNIYTCWALIISSLFFGFVGILCLSSACSNPYADTCRHRFARWQIILAIDIITEVMLVAIPLTLICDILIKRSAKITVLAVFGARLVDIVFASMNLHRIALLEGTHDKALAVVPSMMWTQAELLWSIVSASLPCLKTFMRPFDKIDDDGGGVWNSTQANGYPSTGARSWRVGGDLTWDKESGILPEGNCRRAAAASTSGFRPENVSHDVVISHFVDGEETRRSWGSQEHIIKQSTQVEITREGGGGGGGVGGGGRDPYEIP
ncbi:Hypothetical predicted protein [Lecanosticta acicola]|uniref:Rhodopsin domain-containing protein n=1 Tax=Lecanosticta acicola TaxID=111012 RepID=A0AAI8Z0R1_9PEZI|nr:Hypothetical predicted protein [Lecanosticta acicola]